MEAFENLNSRHKEKCLTQPGERWGDLHTYWCTNFFAMSYHHQAQQTFFNFIASNKDFSPPWKLMKTIIHAL